MKIEAFASLMKCWSALQIICLLYTVDCSESSIKINTDLMAQIVDDNKSITNTNVDRNSSKQNATIDKNENSMVNGIVTTIDDDHHVCLREEQYIEEVRTPSIEPVRVRSSTWCMEFPPRCSNYKTEMREVVKVQNITKTRTIRFCCTGYEGNISINDTICKPVCRGGCGRGYCTKPDICSCEPGYMGKHCTQRCDHDHWGLNCVNACQCLNGAVCDNKSGLCHCTSGWLGEFCEKSCPLGTYGVMCRKECQCPNKLCNPQTGSCDAEGVYAANPNLNVTDAIIANINSTFANITNNLNRLAKNIDSIATTTVGPNAEQIIVTLPMETAEPYSPKAVTEVFLIKQDDVMHSETPKIILHQGGAGLFDNLHNGLKMPDILHVITSDPDPLHNNNSLNNNKSHEDLIEMSRYGNMPGQNDERLKVIVPASSDHDTNLLSMILVILLVALVAIAMGFLYVYRRYHIHKSQVETALAARSMSLVPGVNTPVIITQSPGTPASTASNDIFGIFPSNTGSLSKTCLKPLPDLPAFTQKVRHKVDGPDLYDIANQNAQVNVPIPPRKYGRKESLYSVVLPKSRKPSMDSHLYDEIPYTTSDPIMSTTSNHSLMPAAHNPHAIMNHYTRTQNQFQQQHHLPDQVNDIFIPVPTTTELQHNLTNIAHI